jgi:hypothetical protein
MNKPRHKRSAGGGIRRSVLLGLFAGTGVGVGYLMSGVPNIELVTLLSALAGAALGPGLGAAAGALAATLYSLGNPYGPAIPWLLAAQAAGQAAAGLLGGLVTARLLSLQRAGKRWVATLLAGGVGLFVTLVYDLLTNGASALAFTLDLRMVAVGGLPFMLLHLAGNVLIFALLFPVLAPRAAVLGRPALRGGTFIVCVLACLLAAVPAGAEPAGEAPAESLQVSSLAPVLPDSTPPAPTAPWGRRPLWNPFAGNAVELLAREGPWLVRSDGGFGSRLVLCGEAGTSPAPLFLRDGVPVGTGHRWADDPWVVPLTGLTVTSLSLGADGWGGSAGAVRLDTDDSRPEQTIADTRFYKGSHETYLRSVDFRTSRAPWQPRFDFEETLDQEGYDFRVPGDARFTGLPALGESKFRCGRGSLERWLPRGEHLRVQIETLRKHKTGLPSSYVNHEELWSDHMNVDWRRRTAVGPLRTTFFWTGRDVERNRSRKLEAAREGLAAALGEEGGTRIDLRLLAWRVQDSGADSSWADGDGGPVRGEGQEAGEVGLAGWWDSYGGWQPQGHLACAPATGRRWWSLHLERCGRAPRSDELLTADQVFVPTGSGLLSVALLPERDLQREDTWRGALRLQLRLLGTDLAMRGSLTWLRDGITWRPLPGEPDRGRWSNDLEMLTPDVTASIERAGRCLGWARLRLEAGWQRPSVRAGEPVFLPPQDWARLQLLWEKHLFREDGIFQLGYWLTRQGETTDPWYPGQSIALPAITRHDLILGFRLLGANLSLALRNLTDERRQLSAGALSPGRELRWRLHWTFTQ